MIEKMYYDHFASEYTLEKNPYAPPERYTLAIRGQSGIYIETWDVKKKNATGRWVMDIAFAKEEYYNREQHMETVKWKCEKESCELVRMTCFTMPQEEFDKCVKLFRLDGKDER